MTSFGGGISVRKRSRYFTVCTGIMYKERIYVCHTYYHVYVTLLKEFALPASEQGKATLVLSTMSSDFSNLKERIEKQGIFEQVVEYDEKPHTYFEELERYKVGGQGFVKHLINRIIFTKKLAKLQEPYIPVDFKQYKDIYVYCDSDPIGYYLNYKRIRYHAMEDGLNCIVHWDTARYDNRGHFGLKAFLASMNLLFIQNGYSKYCIDMEVNDLESIRYRMPKMKEVPRKPLADRLTEAEKQKIMDVFVENIHELKAQLEALSGDKKNYIILTEPLCAPEVRKQLFRDLVAEYAPHGNITVKPHPRDGVDYGELFPELIVLEKLVPMEILNFLGEGFFDLAISVLTDINGIFFAKESVRLGPDFLDKYEEASIHRQNEQI